MAKALQPIATFDELLSRAKDLPPQRVAVAAAEDPSVLEALSDARTAGICRAILIGDEPKIRAVAADLGISLDGWEIRPQADPKAASAEAVALIRHGEADILMKGKVASADFLRACLDKENGLRPTRLLSHVAVFEAPRYHKLLFMTDAGINIAPNLQQKAEIVQNAIEAAAGLGVATPKVAILAAIETVNPDMPVTVEAACLTLMAERGQIKGGVVDGPLAFDNAISKSSAEIKGITSPVAGDADILIVPNIETGNSVGKCLIYLGGAAMAGLVIGLKVPIVLTSRSESARGRLISLAWAVYQAGNRT